jgi:Ca2+-binding RTX toxin-like protein
VTYTVHTVTAGSGVNHVIGGDIVDAGAGNDWVQRAGLVFGGDGDDVIEGWGLGSPFAVQAYGEAGNDTLTGGSSNDILDGGAGNDVMQGGYGDDVYWVDSATDQVIEASGAGNDTVRSAISLTLASNVEDLELLGNAAVNGTGNSANNRLSGNAAANVLNGGSGADTMGGGAGDDVYVVNTTGDVVVELADEGVDTIQSSIGWTLGAHVENLTLTGSTAINGAGNDLNNVLTGNSAANVLTGGRGDDTYVVGSGDAVIELAGEGTDTVRSSVTLTLAANVENLVLTGTSQRNGTGNALDNVLTGNSANNTLTGTAGNDTLDGGAGSDTMRGGTGDDTYVVERTTDVVIELAGEGTDTVRSSVTLTLAANVENLVLTGASNRNGTGNALDNVLTGNAANNTLTGNAGRDTLDGGAGTDVLVGGTGNDTYRLGRGHGADTVTDNDATAGNTDKLVFGEGISTDQIWLRQSGNNLELSIIGTGDKATITNWYSGSTYHVEQIVTADGHTLLDSQVQSLVSAMAAFAPPAPGQTTLPPDYQASLQPLIAANWS